MLRYYVTQANIAQKICVDFVLLLEYVNAKNFPSLSRMSGKVLTLQLVAKRVETLLPFEANFRHLDNYDVYPPYTPLISVVCICDQIENLGEQHWKGGGGPNVNEKFLLSTRMFFSWKSHFLLTVSQQFCN